VPAVFEQLKLRCTCTWQAFKSEEVGYGMWHEVIIDFLSFDQLVKVIACLCRMSISMARSMQINFTGVRSRRHLLDVVFVGKN